MSPESTAKVVNIKDAGLPRRLSPEASRLAALEAARELLIETARALGFRAHHYHHDRHAALEKELAELGIA